MRGRVLLGFAAVTGMVFGATGCTQVPEITDAQVTAWNAEAAELFPDLDVKIAGGAEVTMVGSSNYVNVDIIFNDYRDLTSNEPELSAFVERLREEGHDDHPSISAYSADGSREEALETTLSKQASQRIKDAVEVKVQFSYYFDDEGQWERYFYLNINLANRSVLTPERLEPDAEAASNFARQADADWTLLAYYDTSVLDFDGYPDDISPDRVDALTAAADGGCLRTDDWALELGDFFVYVYPADAPGGACA